MQVRQIMQKEVVTCPPESPLIEAARRMRLSDVGCVLIVKEDKLEGILTDRDLVVAAIAEGKDCNSTPIREVMRTEVITCTADTDIEEAAKLMGQNKVRRLAVRSNGKLEGLISISDLSHVLRQEIDAFFAVAEGHCHAH